MASEACGLPFSAGYRVGLRSWSASSGRRGPLSSATSVLVPAVADSDYFSCGATLLVVATPSAWSRGRALRSVSSFRVTTSWVMVGNCLSQPGRSSRQSARPRSGMGGGSPLRPRSEHGVWVAGCRRGAPEALLAPGGGNIAGRRTRAAGGNTGGMCQRAHSRDRRRVVRGCFGVRAEVPLLVATSGVVGPSAKSRRFRVSVRAVARAWSGRATVRVACGSRRRVRGFGHGRSGSRMCWGAISDATGQTRR